MRSDCRLRTVKSVWVSWARYMLNWEEIPSAHSISYERILDASGVLHDKVTVSCFAPVTESFGEIFEESFTSTPLLFTSEGGPAPYLLRAVILERIISPSFKLNGGWENTSMGTSQEV